MMLASLTTLRVGGPAPRITTARTREELSGFCTANPLSHRTGPASSPDVLFVAGGSNLLIADSGFDGPACVIRTSGVVFEDTATGSCRVTAEAGEDWDSFVRQCIAEGLSGLETLSGIPGSVGATPVQNVGAYGTEVAEYIESICVHDRLSGDELTLIGRELEFGYRTSRLKRTAADSGGPRFVVLAVTFLLPRSEISAPLRYAQLAGALGQDLGGRAPVDAVRRAVLRLRRDKGMVLDSADHDTWSAGSFFTNPILFEDHPLPDDAPRYPVVDPITGMQTPGRIKTSAAWLIDSAGFSRGFGVGAQRAALSNKHVLALSNRGSATAADLLELARHVRAGVEEAYGITLEPEPNLVGCAL